MKIIVFCDSSQMLSELVSGTRSLVGGEGEVVALVTGGSKQAVEAAELGADVAYEMPEAPGRAFEDLVPSVVDFVSRQAPDAFFAAATLRGKAVAGFVAASLDTAAVSGAKAVETAEGMLKGSRLVYGGGALRTEHARGATLVSIIVPGCFSNAQADVRTAGKTGVLPFVEPKVSVKKLEAKPKKSSSSDIGSAKRTVGVGRGFADIADLNLARDLAAALDGEVGYSRPVAEGLLEGEPYIGISGISISPDLHVAVGVSGQNQHIVGFNDAKVVACVNKDKNALMFRYSDYGIVGDFHEVLPVLTAALNARK